MKKIILRERERVLSAIGLTLVTFLIIGGWFYGTLEIFIYPESAGATSTVTVSASVVATISCSTNTSTTAFGTLTTAAVTTSTPNASSTMACANSSLGCTLSVSDAGGGGNPGLWNSISSYIIPSPNAAYSATATLAAGTVGYGIQAATSSAGSGAAFAINSRYLQTGNTVGGLSLTGLTLASTTATSSGREVIVTHAAAISTATVGGTYNDTITYSCVGN